MPHLEKQIQSVYGTSASCLNFALTHAELLPDGQCQVKGNLKLYTSQADYEAGKALVDNFTFDYKIAGEAFLQAALAIFAKIQESKLEEVSETLPSGEVVVKQVEKNVLSGNVGVVGFQDAVLVP